MIYCGIDVGRNGGIACVNHAGELLCYSRIGQLEKTLATFNELLKNVDEIIYEELHAIYGCSSTSTFELGRSVGWVDMWCACNHKKYTCVLPRVWQAKMFVEADKVYELKKNKLKLHTKKTARNACVRTCALDQAHDGINDAVLLAFYLKSCRA